MHYFLIWPSSKCNSLIDCNTECSVSFYQSQLKGKRKQILHDIFATKVFLSEKMNSNEQYKPVNINDEKVAMVVFILLQEKQ